jgi:zinc protease
VAAITRADLESWHRRYFVPNAVVLGLVGDFDRAAALREVEAAFGDWPRGTVVASRGEQTLPAPAPRHYFVEKSNVTQSNIAFGTIGLRKDSPDFYAVQLMNEVLGGGFTSRLFSNVRTKKGLAYGVAGLVGTEYDHPGMTLFWLSTKTETTGAAIDAVLEEVRGMATRPPEAPEVARAKAAILNSFIFAADTPGEVLGAQVRYEFFGYPLDRLARYRAGIESVTLEQVVAAARKYMRPEALSMLVVGPSAGLDRPLSSFGPVENRDVSIAPPGGGSP